jgi:nucleoid DNA-binding protein
MPVKKKAPAKKRKPAARKVAKPAKKKTVAKKKPAVKAAKKRTSTSKAKTSARKATVKKSASVEILKSAPSVKDPFTKTELNRTISAMTGLATKDVKNVLDSLEGIIQEHIKARGPQVFTLPGLAKIKVIRKPATKARKGVNPFTGEACTFKAKPARNVVKVLALKKLKEMAK